MTAETDTENRLWLKNIAAGDQSAMREFYNAHESRVYAYAKNKLNDSHAAADIVNEVMIAVWQGAGKFQARSKVRSWLLSIAHFKIIDLYRRNSRADMTELNETLPDETSVSALEIVGIMESRNFIEECMKRLSESHREVIHLCFFEELTYREVAQVVGCPEGTVKTRMFYARQQLKHCLKRYIPVDEELRVQR